MWNWVQESLLGGCVSMSGFRSVWSVKHANNQIARIIWESAHNKTRCWSSHMSHYLGFLVRRFTPRKKLQKIYQKQLNILVIIYVKIINCSFCFKDSSRLFCTAMRMKIKHTRINTICQKYFQSQDWQENKH